jgi:ribosomal protein S12 methylthiotransferase
VRAHMTDLASALGDLGMWIRLHYVYPYPHVDDVIPLMAEGKILPYLDIPFQHASPQVLKAMKRPADHERILERIASWRDVCPDITIRSTFIVGFPGETENDFSFLLQWLEEARLDRVGCFKYEHVDGAAANALPGAVDPDEMDERWERLMETQHRISTEKMQAKIDRTLDVIIDEADETGAIGRTKGDAPEIDGTVTIADGQDLEPGDIVSVTITDAGDYDLTGRLTPGPR